MKINSYSFGSMTVNDVVYDKDLIIFPDKISPNWWRKQSHTLLIEDLEEVIKYKPRILVVGKGAQGVMTVPESTKESLKEKNIEVIEKNTDQAYKLFNEYVQKGERVVGAFHLTC